MASGSAMRNATIDYGIHHLVPGGREARPSETALVVIDLTKFDAHPRHGYATVMRDSGSDLSYYFARVERETIPNCVRLIDEFRSYGGRLVWTRVGGQFDDYGDVQPNLRRIFRESGSHRGTEEYPELDEFVPRVGEAIVDKSGSSAFTSGNLDVVLRHAGVRNVVFCGVVTNACVLTSALAAWDLGYSVQIVGDACASTSQEMHDAGLAVAEYLGCRITDTDTVINELAGVGNGSASRYRLSPSSA